MNRTLDQLAVIERRDAWIRRLSQVFFAALFALLLTGAIVGALAFILGEREQTQRDSRAAASRRIDMLTATVDKQSKQIAGLQGQVGALTTTSAALVAQLRQNNLVPVVQPAPGPTPAKTADPTPRPTSGPAPRPRPSTSPSPSRPAPSPPPCTVRVPVTGRCVLSR